MVHTCVGWGTGGKPCSAPNGSSAIRGSPATAAPAALVPVLWVAAVATGESVFAVPSIHLFLFGGVLSLWAWRRKPWARTKRVRVEVDRDAITVGEERIARQALTRGVIVARDGNLEVHIAKPWSDLQLRIATAESARHLLTSLGFDEDQAAATFRTMSRSFTSIPRTVATILAAGMLGMLGAAANLAGSEATNLGAAAILWMVSAFVLLLTPSHVEVGADGVLIKWLGSQRFVSHGDITDVQITSGFGNDRNLHVDVVLTSGETVRIPVTNRRWDDGRTAGLATRILEAREVYRRGGAEAEALLMRGDRPLERWITALRARELVGHRDQALPKDRLWRVIEDVAAKPIERAAAAVALGRGLGESDRERLARAARAAVAPKLRVVLESVADAEDDVLAEQLASLERAKRKERGR